MLFLPSGAMCQGSHQAEQGSSRRSRKQTQQLQLLTQCSMGINMLSFPTEKMPLEKVMLTFTTSLDNRELQGLGGGNVWLNLISHPRGGCWLSRQGNNTWAGEVGCNPGIREDRHWGCLLLGGALPWTGSRWMEVQASVSWSVIQGPASVAQV